MHLTKACLVKLKILEIKLSLMKIGLQAIGLRTGGLMNLSLRCMRVTLGMMTGGGQLGMKAGAMHGLTLLGV